MAQKRRSFAPVSDSTWRARQGEAVCPHARGGAYLSPVVDGHRYRLTLINDIALVEGRYPSVSAHHCRFARRGEVLTVEDLGSSNGTLVNGQPIDGAVELAVGDLVRLGSVGPKFLVVGGRELNDTVFVRREELRPNTGEVEEIVEQFREALAAIFEDDTIDEETRDVIRDSFEDIIDDLESGKASPMD